VQTSAAALSSVEFRKNGDLVDSDTTIVFAHGFGSGRGFFYKHKFTVHSLMRLRDFGRLVWNGRFGTATEFSAAQEMMDERIHRRSS
jgi:hypothetical protein